MNWYKRSHHKQPIVKTASTEETVSGHGQEGWIDSFGDIQRYSLDAYTVAVFKTTTKNKLSVSVTLTMNQVGTIMWQKFWKYDLDEKSKAQATFKAAKKIVNDVFNEFRSSEIPNATLWQYLREACKEIDPDNEAKSNIPHINWSRQVKYEKDIRSQLYGKRYPEQNGY